MKKLLLAGTVLLAACATSGKSVYWYKAGSSEDQFAHDRLQCQQYATQRAQLINGSNPFGALFIGGDVEECLRGLGYQKQYR